MDNSLITKMENIHNRNIRMKTDYKVGDTFTYGYVPITIVEVCTDEEGVNFYKLDSGRYVSGYFITVRTDWE